MKKHKDEIYKIEKKKLDFRNNLKENYANRIERAQNEVEDLFTNTILDAKTGFKITLVMDCIVFFVGICLIITTGCMAIINDDTENSDYEEDDGDDTLDYFSKLAEED